MAIAWAEYLKKATGLSLPAFWSGSTSVDGHFQFGINIIAFAVITLVTIILIFGGINKSAKLNFFLVCLKLTLLAIFLIVGIRHIDTSFWTPFFPTGATGVLQGAALAVFPYVGFDALYTFARESKSPKDTTVSTYLCVGVVAFLYVTVMAVATGLAPAFINGVPNEAFAGTEAAAPLAVLLTRVGEGWTAKLIALGAVLGIFNVLLVLCMGGPRIFRNMAEDGLLPPIFKKSIKGNPLFGTLINGAAIAITAALVPFGEIADMMVLGTLIAFIFVCLGALRLKLVHPIIALLGLLGCLLLACNLNPLVLKLYSISCPFGLALYFIYGFRKSKLRNTKSNLDNSNTQPQETVNL